MDGHTPTGAAAPERRPAAPILADRGTLVCLLAVAVSLAGWLWAVTGAPPRALAVLLFVAWPAGALRAGRALTAAAGVTAAFALPFLVGSAALAIGLTLVKIFVPVSLPVAVWAALAAAWLVPWILPDRRAERGPVRTDWGETFAVVLCLAGATAWSQHGFPPTVPSDGAVIFKPWSDHFTHAAYVARFLHHDSILHLGHYELQGQPAYVYHYASYAFPAAFASIAHCSAYDSLCAFWVPLGLVLLGLAGYALGRTCGGHGPGLAALAVALLLPDPSTLPVANPMLGFFNVLVTNPGSLYGVAVAAAALAVVVDAARRGDRLGLFGALGLAVCTAGFKTHIFLASFPLTVGFAALACRGTTLRARCLVLAGLVVAAGVAVKLNNLYRVGPTLRPDLSGGDFYFRALAFQVPDSGWGAWYAVFRPEGGFAAHLGRAGVLLLLATFGAFLLLWPLTTLWALARRKLQPADLLPLGATAIYLAMALGLPRNRGLGTPEELQHRPFVWAYFVVAAVTAARGVTVMGNWRPRWAGRAGALGCLALLAVPVALGPEIHCQRTQWGPSFVNVKVPRGLVACARFIARQRPVSSLVQDSDLKDESLIFGGLCQRRSFLARPFGWESVWNNIGQTARAARCAESRRRLEQLKHARTLSELQTAVAATGIHWYLRRPGDEVTWPPAVQARAAFEADGYRVYDLRACLAPATAAHAALR